MSEITKRGYLNEKYRLFHISDKRDVDFESHSHDFHKIIICFSGNVKYIMEGKTYGLCSGDVLFVPKGKIHRSVLNSEEVYERAVLWIEDAFLRNCEEDGNSLATCFDMALMSDNCAVSPAKDEFAEIHRLVAGIESMCNTHLFGKNLMKDSFFIQLMVVFNRLMLEQKSMPGYTSDSKFDEILAYVNSNLSEDLSVDRICEKFFISRSYLLHKFKALTGCSMHGYIIQKRLAKALEMMNSGMNANTAAQESGFSDYTVFYRNFKKYFGVSPAQLAEK